MQPEAPAEGVEALRAARQLGEHAHLDRAQQRLRGPERQARLQNPLGSQLIWHFSLHVRCIACPGA